MKRTYKLLGLEWDHAPLPQECPAFSTEKEVQNWNVDRDLFDLQIYERQLLISELMSAEKKNMVRHMLEYVKDCDSVFIKLDYEPASEAEAVIKFYVLRLLQIFEFVRTELPIQTQVIIIGSTKIMNLCREMLLEKQSAVNTMRAG